MNHSITTLALASLFVISGCSNNSKPSSGDIEKAFGSGVVGCPTNVVVARNVKKTNGLEHGNAYEVEFDYELHFLVDLPRWNNEKRLEDQTPEILQLVQCIGNLQMANVYGVSNPDDIPKKGSSYEMTGGTMLMVRSEKGWIRSK